MNVPKFDELLKSIPVSCWFDNMPFYTVKAIGEYLGQKSMKSYLVIRPHLTAYGEIIDGIEYYSVDGLVLIMISSKKPKATEFQIALAIWMSEKGRFTELMAEVSKSEKPRRRITSPPPQWPAHIGA